MNEVWQHFWGHHKKKLIATIISLIILFFFFGTQITLYLQFLVGNDIIINLKASPEEVTLLQSETKNIQVDLSATANPFCEVLCTGLWKDITSQKTLSQDQFSLRTGSGKQSTFTPPSPNEGEGYALYRYEIKCQGQKALLCHTSEIPTRAATLITVHYILTDEQKKIKDQLQQTLNLQLQDLNQLESTIELIETNLPLWHTLFTPSDLNSKLTQINQAKSDLQIQQRSLEDLNAFWQQQQYTKVQKIIQASTLEQTKTNIQTLWQNVNTTLTQYNLIVQTLNNLQQQLANLNEPISNQTLNDNLNNLITKYNAVATLINTTPSEISITNATPITTTLPQDITDIEKTFTQQRSNEIQENELQLAISAHILCTLSGTCFPSLTPLEIINTTQNINQSCQQKAQFNTTYSLIQKEMTQQAATLNYAQNPALSNNISLYIHNLQQDIKEQYRTDFINLNLPPPSTLEPEQKVAVSFNSTINATPLAIIQLAKTITTCITPNTTLIPIQNLSLSSITIPTLNSLSLPSSLLPTVIPTSNISFTDPQPRCCALHSCTSCCTTNSCSNDNYPILFIHGHAFNKDLSAEYSLNAFNPLQEKLEEQGYINAGAISLYTLKDTTPGIWGLFKTPISLKGSYYYDMYFAQGGYKLVQQKSEHIDTYAVRLKELIDTIKYKTGKTKVIIIAHSMGGLVARDYLSIFGSDSIEKLIMIGTPNQGIVGNIAQYCDIIGEQRECEDMNSNSLFISKLNSQKPAPIPLYTIVGIGCPTTIESQTQDGDGIVLKENAQLEGAKTFFIKGSCDSLQTLHTQLLDIEKYPQVYTNLLQILKE